MKKFYILAAIALVAGVSCTKQVPADNNSPDVAISFSPISQRVGTKANVFGEQNATYTTGATSAYESFTAEAYYTKEASTTTNPQTNSTASAGQSFFTGIENTHQGTAPDDYWAPATPYYWPRDGYLHFHAASPYGLTEVGASAAWAHTWANGYVLNNFVAPLYVDSNATATQTDNTQVDILYSDFVFDRKRSQYDPHDVSGFPYDDDDNPTATTPTSPYAHHGVNLTFNHALAAVEFKVATDMNYAGGGTGVNEHHFYVTKIEVLNPLKNGTFTENRKNDLSGNVHTTAGFASTPAYTDGKVVSFYKDQATTTAAQPSPYWTATTTGTPATDEQNYTPYYNTDTPVDASLFYLTNATVDDRRSAQLGTTLLVMPQILDHKIINAALNDVQVRVTYNYSFKLGTQTYEYNDLTVTTTLAGRVSDAYNETSGDYTVNYWLINHKYIYTLVFKLDPIIFDPMVEAFVNVSNIDVDLPFQS